MEFNAWVALGSLAFLLVLMAMGVPIWISMAVAACIGFLLVDGTTFTFMQFSSIVYNITADYNFAVIPMFILMSVLAADCGIGAASFDTFSKWIGGVRGGLLHATILGSALFGACSGMPQASCAIFAKVAVPELNKYKYDTGISTACIAASSTISSLIPPSVSIVIFCILLNVSIGKALVAGIIPGILLTVLLMLTVVTLGIIKPQSIPRAGIRTSWGEKFKSLRLTGPLMIVIIVIVGGIYLGIFPPTTSGAIGSACVLIIALVKKVKMKTIAGSFLETALLNAQLYPLVIGGFLYARFIALSGLPVNLVSVINDANLSPFLLFLVIIIFYLFIGCVMDFFSMVIVTLPLIFPILTAMDYPSFATIIFILVLGAISGLTPPVGMGVFTVASVARVKPEIVFKGILPFYMTCMIMLVLIIIFPQICTWLPDLIYI